MRKTELLLLLLLGLAAPASAVTIDWVPIGNPGNPADSEVMFDGTTGYGSVGYVYQIGRYEVTNTQYAEFLNTVAQAADPYQLYDPFMDRSQGFGEGSGIVRGGTPGSFTYTVDAGRENRPVNYVSVFDTMRFANWLNNGQGSGDTETGSYTLEGGTPTPTNYTVTRNPGLGIFLPTEDEWYKAAYYDAVTTSYFDYPTATNTPTTCTATGPTPNTANCAGQAGNEQIAGGAFTDVGAYTGSPSPYGTYDQGGNVYDYTETLTGNAPTVGDDPPPVGPAILRILRGSSYVDRQEDLAAKFRRSVTADTNFAAQGFRVVQVVPEPGTALLVTTGMLILAGRRRRRARR